MNIPLKICNNGWQVLSYIGLVLIAICFVFIHFKSNPAETQLSNYVWLLPLFCLLPLNKRVYKAELICLMLTFLIFISSVFSYGLQGEVFTNGFRNHWVYLLGFGIFSVFIHFKITASYLYVLLGFSSLAIVIDVSLEFFGHGTRGDITHGKPIFFGNIALTSALVSFILFLDRNNKWFVRALLLLTAVSGLAGSIWSQTRGGWIFLMVFIFTFLFIYIRNSKSKKKTITYVLITFIALVFTSLPFTKSIETRINAAYSNIEDYFYNHKPNTSIGLRFEFWKVSFEQFVDDPFTGSARSGFLAKQSDMLETNSVTPKIRGFTHSHSDLFWTMGTKGLIGLVSLYGFYLMLMCFYYYHLKKENVKLYAISGIVLVSSYAIYGLSESFFSMKLGIGYFLIFNLILIRIISIASNKKPIFSGLIL
jgi:O-antigen ligase